MTAKTENQPVPVDFAQVRKAFEQVGQAISDRMARREALAQERDQVAALPMHRADLIARVGEWIDSVRPLYLKHLETVVGPLSRKPDRPLPEARNGDFGLIGFDGKVQPLPLIALLGPILKDALAKAIDELPIDDTDALPAEERRDRLARLDAAIEQMDAEIADLHRQAETAGLVKVRRQPTREEINAHFAHGRPTDPADVALAVENLTRRLNGEPDIKRPPLPAAPTQFIPDRDLPDDF